MNYGKIDAHNGKDHVKHSIIYIKKQVNKLEFEPAAYGFEVRFVLKSMGKNREQNLSKSI